jgi:hypothetical protein
MSTAERQVPGRAWRARKTATSATISPSARLSARQIRIAYFSEMIRMSDQRISDTTSSTDWGGADGVVGKVGATSVFRCTKMPPDTGMITHS